MKHGEETKDHINWKVNIRENDSKEQIAIVVAEATLNGHTEYYYYNFFSFTFGKADRKFEFSVCFSKCKTKKIIIIIFSMPI